MPNLLDKNLARALNTIESCLMKNVTKAVELEEEALLKKMGLSKKIEKIAELEAKKEEIEQTIRVIENEISQEKKWHLHPVPQELLDLGCSNYSPNKVSVESYKKVAKLPAGKNFLAFKKIESTVKAMYDLAINNKEKREIILSLQNQNWRDLGINLPPINSLGALKIDGGLISLSSFEQLPPLEEA